MADEATIQKLTDGPLGFSGPVGLKGLKVIADRACAVRKDAFQDAPDLAVGDMVTGQVEGKPFRAKVLAVGDDDITLDLNHPLAGKTLHFTVEIVGIE